MRCQPKGGGILEGKTFPKRFREEFFRFGKITLLYPYIHGCEGYFGRNLVANGPIGNPNDLNGDPKGPNTEGT